MSVGYYSVIFGLLYTWLIGFLVMPQGFGAALVSIFVLLISYKQASEFKLQPKWYERLLLLGGVITSVSFCFNSNYLINVVSASATAFIVSMFLIAATYGGNLPVTFGSYMARLLEMSAHAIHDSFRARRVSLSCPRVEKDLWLGLVLAIVPLTIFHLLFSLINHDYAVFVEWIVAFIIDLDFLQYLFKAAVQAYLFHCLFCTAKADQIEARQFARYKAWAYALIPCIALFAVFSPFQAKLLLIDVDALQYQALSLYTQRGFWELLLVSLIGLIVWTAVQRSAADISQRMKTVLLQRIFCAELVLIAIFAMHKIICLQSTFGLKDSRVLSSAVTLFPFLTFAICVIWAKHPALSVIIFRSQTALGVALAALFACANLDRLVSTTVPIKYWTGNYWQKDYSYLLTNSYDNYELWGDIMLSALEENIEPPADYYWGDYKPLCLLRRNGVLPKKYLEDFHRALIDSSDHSGLQQMMRRNFRSIGARNWLKANQGLISDMYKHAEQHCSAHYSDYPLSSGL